MQIKEKWTVCNKTGDYDRIRKTFGISGATARLLINRGKNSEKDIREYLYPDVSYMHSPKLMKNLDKAADIIEKKVLTGAKIRVVGDYDADGIMSTYILIDSLKRIGANVDYYIPDRVKDGYGINRDIILAAAESGIDTVITCDNGISAVDAAEEAKNHNITLIITDHHEIPEKLPEAEVIVDPKLQDDTYPCKAVCGAVVAAKLASELLERKGLEPEGKGALPYLEYMAIATICDVVPLTDENRTIASCGLKRLNKDYIGTDPALDQPCNPGQDQGEYRNSFWGSRVNVGLKALIDACELKRISDSSIGFVIGPCLNATGRLDLARKAMLLLDTKDREDALKLAQECRQLNESRKDMTFKETEKAVKMLDDLKELDKVLVVFLPDCHESLAGIIAGRIREKYYRPVFVLTKGKDGIKGSGRSIPGYNMFGELQKCSGLLAKFGGHPMAAGLSLSEENIDAFRQQINEVCTLSDEDMIKTVSLDAQVAVSCFDEKSISELELFYPCGQGNPSPLFGDARVKLTALRRIGKNSNFLKLTLVDSRGKKADAICFLDAGEILAQMVARFGKDKVDSAFNGAPSGIEFSICYVPEVDEYNGVRTIKMRIHGFRF